MIKRYQYRCTFKDDYDEKSYQEAVAKCREKSAQAISSGQFCNISFYRYENMGFVYVEKICGKRDDGRENGSMEKDIDARGNVREIIEREEFATNESIREEADINERKKPEMAEFTANESTREEEIENLVGNILADIKSFLKIWPREERDTYFVPMINVYYHHIPEEDLDIWEKERTTATKTRVGRVAFVYPDKLTSYILHHKEIVDEGLLRGDKYAYISMHENLLFSYYEEPRNNVNITGSDQESKAIERWLAVDPESHFDRVKAKGDNFLVIPCLFSVDRVDGFICPQGLQP